MKTINWDLQNREGDQIDSLVVSLQTFPYLMKTVTEKEDLENRERDQIDSPSPSKLPKV